MEQPVILGNPWQIIPPHRMDVTPFVALLNRIDGLSVNCGIDSLVSQLFDLATKNKEWSDILIAQTGQHEQSSICSALRAIMVPSTSEDGKEAALQTLCAVVSRKLNRSRFCQCVNRDPSACFQPRTAISKAFLMPYQGKATLALLYGCIMDMMSDRNTFYAPMVTVVQHSGSGKTRACMELGMTVCPLIYICYREKNQEGYPNPAPSSLREYLLFESVVNPLPPLTVYLRYVSFIVAALISFRIFWQAVDEENGTEETIRDRLQQFLNVQLQGSLHQSTEKSSFFEWLHVVARDIETSLGKMRQAWSFTDWQSLENCIQSWLKEELPLRHPTLVSPRDFYGVICFDEEHIFARQYTDGNVLNNPNLKNERQTLSVHMQRATRLLRDYYCTSIRMDTTPELDVFRPTPLLVKTIPSARGLLPGVHHCLYYLMLERNLGAAKAPMKLRDGIVNSVSYMSRFGAPIWHSLYQAGATTTILAEAERKLFGGIVAVEPSGAISMKLSAACIGATAHLDVGPWFSLSSNLVSRHMAQLEHLDRSINVCLMGYPPDMILAAVAMKELLRKERFAKHMDNLAAILHQQFVSIGEATGLIGRLLCLMAAYCSPQNDWGSSEMTVTSFLQNLCPHPPQPTPPLKRPRRSASIDATAKMMDGRMNLRQFVPLRNKKELSREALCLGAQRGFGFITAHCQEGFDAIIPVVLRDPAFETTCKASSDVDSSVAAEKAPAVTMNTQEGSKTTSNFVPDLPLAKITEATANSTPQWSSVQPEDAKGCPTADIGQRENSGSQSGTLANERERDSPAACTQRDDANKTVLEEPTPNGSKLRTLLATNARAVVDEWNQSLSTKESNWVARNGEVTFSLIKAQMADMQQSSAQPQRKSILRPVAEAETTSNQPYDITPDRVTFLAIQFKFRSRYQAFTCDDPLQIFDSSDSFRRLHDVVPRMALVMAFVPYRGITDQQLPPAQCLPSALVTMTTVNPHHHWSSAVADPIENILRKLCTVAPIPLSGDTVYSLRNLEWLYAANLPMGS